VIGLRNRARTALDDLRGFAILLVRAGSHTCVLLCPVGGQLATTKTFNWTRGDNEQVFDENLITLS